MQDVVSLLFWFLIAFALITIWVVVLAVIVAIIIALARKPKEENDGS